MNSETGRPNIAETRKLFATGALSRRELERSQRRAIRRLNGRLNAFISVFPESGPGRTRGPLGGITVAVKDNMFTAGARTTAGSRALRNFVPAYDADVVTDLRAAGATIIGKTNLHEFAFGVTNINEYSGDCRNPWRQDRVSGGSSGGSAVAVATGMACAAVGTDTGGSVRIPASLCGVVGYKPTRGLISIGGIVPLAWSLDTVGFLTRSVSDAATLASLTFARRRSRPVHDLKPGGLKGMKLGVPWDLIEPLDDDVRARFHESLALAAQEGARVLPVKIGRAKEAAACRSMITHAEAASFHRELFSSRYRDYGRDMRQLMARGLAIPARAYLDALRARGALLADFRTIFRRADLLALPTTRIPAPTIRESRAQDSAKEVRAALLALPEPFNLFGTPAISIPCGLTRDRLPVGLQLAADTGCDARLLSAAMALERALPRLPAPRSTA